MDLHIPDPPYGRVPIGGALCFLGGGPLGKERRALCHSTGGVKAAGRLSVLLLECLHDLRHGGRTAHQQQLVDGGKGIALFGCHSQHIVGQTQGVLQKVGGGFLKFLAGDLNAGCPAAAGEAEHGTLPGG